MGMNFYTKTEKCLTCGHKPDRIHLGKSSFGWKFSFQYNDGKYYENVKEMQKWLKDKKIEDECGQEITYLDFWRMVKKKQKESHCHAKEYPSINDFVIDGYSFTNTDFF